MSNTDGTPGNNTRKLALARRKALSGSGKAALHSGSVPGGGSAKSSATVTTRPKVNYSPGKTTSTSSTGSRAASLSRRRAMSTRGKSGVSSGDRTRTREMVKSSTKAVLNSEASKDASEKNKDCSCGCNKGGTKIPSKTTGRRASGSLLKTKPKKVINSDSCRAGALARRKALSVRGKAGISKSGMSSAQTARATNPDLTSRELARTLRDQKSRKGNAGQKTSTPTRRVRPARNTDTGAAKDAPWKVGASDTSHGQTVTGTMVGHKKSMTGDESGTCRDVTGTEYLGADIFKDFCQTEPVKSVQRGGQISTVQGNSVTGNRVGRSQKVTGDEPGTCKSVTGTEYVDMQHSLEFCGTAPLVKKEMRTPAKTDNGKKVTGVDVSRTEKVTGNESGAGRQLTGTQYTQMAEGNAPDKVGNSATLSGGSITGSMVGRSEHVTGDETGSCRNVTGDDYIGQEQFKDFCQATPDRTEKKVGVSSTLNGEAVTGTMTGRSSHVTGDEPGTCKSVTGTPYAGAEQYQGFCEADQTNKAAFHMQKNKAFAGAAMTGIQPAVGGKMTGDSKGVCEAVSGTPYVGRDQVEKACGSVAAEPASSDFPQSLAAAMGSDFSVTSPAEKNSPDQTIFNGVTGSSYGESSSITGPFGMASGVVTGTEEARFNRPAKTAPVQPAVSEMNDERSVSRVTGEGMSAGKVTGDDWDRGERVTGTEGRSSIKRNPTMRGSAPNIMSPIQNSRNEEIAAPISRVTGGSGNTENGSLITYSGGARG